MSLTEKERIEILQKNLDGWSYYKGMKDAYAYLIMLFFLFLIYTIFKEFVRRLL